MQNISINSVIHGDCLEVMQDIPDHSIDLILCDLPYGTTACKWDSVIPFEPLWKHYKRIIRPNGAIVLTASQPFTSALVVSNPDWFRYSLVWDKCITTGHLNAKKRPLRRHEDILVFGKGALIYNPIMKTGKLRSKVNGSPSECYGHFNKTVSYNDQYYPTSIIEFSNAHQSAKVHSTQKPVALLEYLIKTYTNESDLVLDNCAGSGTTAIAAIRTNRNYILIEKEVKYFELCNQRIQDELNKPKQSSLFDL